MKFCNVCNTKLVKHQYGPDKFYYDCPKDNSLMQGGQQHTIIGVKAL